MLSCITFALGVLHCDILCRKESSLICTCNFLSLLCLLLLLYPALPWVREPTPDYICQRQKSPVYFACAKQQKTSSNAERRHLLWNEVTKHYNYRLVSSTQKWSWVIFPKNHPFLKALDSFPWKLRSQVSNSMPGIIFLTVGIFSSQVLCDGT